MLKRMDIESFKVIRELSVDLDRFTVLIGPNACGKSSALQAIGHLCAMRDTAPREIFVDRAAIEHIHTRGLDQRLALGGCVGDTSFRWRVDESAGTASLEMSGSAAGKWDDAWSQALRHRLPAVTAAGLPSAVALHFEFERLAAPAIMPVGEPRVAPDGSGLAAVLAHLALEHRDCFDRIKQAAVQVIPAIRDIRIRNTRVSRLASELSREPWVARRDDPHLDVPAHELVFDATSGARGIPAHAMSDGTLRLLGLLTVVLGDTGGDGVGVGVGTGYGVGHGYGGGYGSGAGDGYGHGYGGGYGSGAGSDAYADSDADSGSDAYADADSGSDAYAVADSARPRLLLLDNIERGMHPRALYEVVNLLRGALDQQPGLQIVAATHSADLLDYIDASQIRLLWLGDDGFTRCVRMTEHPKYDEWKALMTPSELWAEMDRSQRPPGDAE